jgi:hypothetical protein
MPRSEPPLRWRVLRLPKGDHTPEEYEDAWAADPAAGRFAVADGASESTFAGLWARLLVEGFVAARRRRGAARWLDGARRRWAEQVMGLELPWYGEMKRAEGAFATLLGLAVQAPAPDRPGRWRAVAVGDSCLVHVRQGQPLRAFPLGSSADFGNEPRLIGSWTGPMPTAEYASGSLAPGDRLFLMTDALAQWFLYEHEGGRRPWEAVEPMLDTRWPEEAFAAWVGGLRASGGLRDDDVTLLAIESGLASGEGPS